MIFGLPLFLAWGYFWGSIPFGLILAKVFGYGDIRKVGSGNIGATNVLRTGNKLLAAATLILDAGKGFAAVFVIHGIAPLSTEYPIDPAVPNWFIMSVILTTALGATLGHCFPIWLKFKGGKGVATALGALLAAVPYAGLAACAAWLIVAKITKISSLSALIAVSVAPIVTLIVYGIAPAVICALITLLVWIRHKDNIKRLLNGAEPKIGSGKKKNESVSKQD